MDIDFQRNKDAEIISDSDLLKKKYGKRGSEAYLDIISTIDVLHAAESLADVPLAYRPHPLQGEYKGCFAINVDKKNRMIFRPNYESESDYRIDQYSTINRIVILEIYKDYHK